MMESEEALQTATSVQTRAIETPSQELDEPPSQSGAVTEQLTAEQQKDLFKWLRNFDFLKWVVLLLFLVFFIDVLMSIYVPSVVCSLTDQLFDTLKTVLFMVSGYMFGKGNEK